MVFVRAVFVCDVFAGFGVNVDLCKCVGMQDVANFAKIHLREHLSKFSFEELEKCLQKRSYYARGEFRELQPGSQVEIYCDS